MSASHKVEHVESLTRREWLWFMVLLVPLSLFVSYSALYQGLKVGQFDSGGMIAMILGYPLVRYLMTRKTPGRTIHIVNHLQTAVAAAGASAGMGSMLLAYEWVSGKKFTAWEISSIAVLFTVFGILAANLFAELQINKQKLKFVGGFAGGEMLKSIGKGGKSLQLLGAGTLIAIPFFIWESPYAAVAIGTGWILGWEIMGWAMVTGLILKYLEPVMVNSHLIKNGQPFNRAAIYFGACAILVAGIVDLTFSFFKTVEDHPEFSTRDGFMPRKSNLFWMFLIAMMSSATMQYLFDMPWYTTMAVYGGLVLAIYIVTVASGKTGIAPVSAMSGSIITLLAMVYPPGLVLAWGAGLGQAIANSLEVGNDFRMGERVGSSLKLQRKTQIIGGLLGGSLIVGPMYTFITNAYGKYLTYDLVSTSADDLKFNAAFALKYHAFLTLSEKFKGPIGTTCLWITGIVVIVQMVKNICAIRGFKFTRFIPSVYACSIACFLPLNTTKTQFMGGMLAVAMMIIWRRYGKSVNVTGDDSEKPEQEPQLMGINWSYMIGLACGLIVGETLMSFADATLIMAGYEKALITPFAKAMCILAMGIIGAYSIGWHITNHNKEPNEK